MGINKLIDDELLVIILDLTFITSRWEELQSLALFNFGRTRTVDFLLPSDTGSLLDRTGRRLPFPSAGPGRLNIDLHRGDQFHVWSGSASVAAGQTPAG